MSEPHQTPIPRWRFVTAYWVTFVILVRYFVFFAVRRILPQTIKARFSLSLHQKTSRTIVATILKLKGLYIKIGQTLSIMTNFLPPSFTDGLEKLQDAVPPHPYQDVEARFLKDFGKTPAQLFDRFDKTPIASASLGQVHVAYLKDGTKLAVKLQYPDIDETVKSDLTTIKKIFGLIDLLFPNYGLTQVYEECSKMILEELDYEFEAANITKIQNNFKNQPDFIFPQVYPQFSSQKILTVSFIEGNKVTDLDYFKQHGISPHALAVSLLHSYCQQIFTDGVYHADPHPGNILIQSTSDQDAPYKIGLVDFGATGTIAPHMKAGLTLFVEGLIKKDTKALSNAMKQMGFIAKEENEEAFDKIVEYFYSKIRGIKIENFKEINIAQFQNLNDLFELQKMDISFKELTSTFHVPKDWILIERTLILLMGIITHLDPHLNPLDIIIPYVEEFVLGQDKNVGELILETSKELLLSYINLPTEINKVVKKLNEGKIVIRNVAQEKQTKKIYHGIHQLIYTMLLITSLGFGYLWGQNGNTQAWEYANLGAGFFGLLLAISLLKNR